MKTTKTTITKLVLDMPKTTNKQTNLDIPKTIIKMPAQQLAIEASANNNKKVGIVQGIINCIENAMANNSNLSISQIHTHLKRLFPERCELSMLRTIKTQIYSQDKLAKKGYRFQKVNPSTFKITMA